MTSVEGSLVSPAGEIKGYATVALEPGQVHQFAGYAVVASGLNDIAIGDLYVMCGHCGPTFKLACASGTTFAVGDTVQWDDTNNLCVASGDFAVGIATRAKAAWHDGSLRDFDMSEFDDLVKTFAVPQLMHFFGDNAVIDYANASDARSGVTTTHDITAVVDPEQTQMELTDSGEQKTRIREVHVHSDEQSEWKGIENPELHGTITFDGDTWRIREVIDRDDNWVHFEVVKIGQQEHVKKGFRRD